jgi:hypothetical protein
MFKNSVRTSKTTLPVNITDIDLLTLFKEIIPLYTENHKEPINTKCRVMFIKVTGKYSYHSALKG